MSKEDCANCGNWVKELCAECENSEIQQNEKDYAPTSLDHLNFNSGYNAAIETAEKIISDYIKQAPAIKTDSTGHLNNIKIIVGQLKLISA